MQRPISRRAMLAGLGLTVAWAVTGCGAGGRQSPDTTNILTFANPLRIPPLAGSMINAEGRRIFPLRAQAGTSTFLAGKRTTTWGLNGPYLGPTLRARRGEAVGTVFNNDLAEATSVHWHGMHLPAAMDGGPHQVVAARGQWEPRWQIDQPATTLWYHPHPHGQTEAQLNRGLAGLFLIDDDAADALPLPKRYGVDDIPIIVQDRSFDGAGQFNSQSRGTTGLLGNTSLINGTLDPYLDVTTTLVRFRLLNASTARCYNSGFSDEREFALIATDGGLLDATRTDTRVQLSPGERAEIVVRLCLNEPVTLRSFAPDLGLTGSLGDTAGGRDILDVPQFRPGTALADETMAPDRLLRYDALDLGNVAMKRDFVLRGRQINDKNMDLKRIDAVVTAGNDRGLDGAQRP